MPVVNPIEPEATRLIVDSDTGQELTANEHVFGNFICQLRSFNVSIRSLRQGLPSDVEYIPVSCPLAWQDMLTRLSDEQHRHLKQGVKRICQRYGLSRNWEAPIMIAVLTGHLPIVPDRPLFLQKPLNTSDSLTDVLTNLYQEVPIAAPAIYPVYKVTINQLKKFIDDNKEEIQGMMSTLPAAPRIDIQEHTALWGKIAWHLRNEEPQPSWLEIAEFTNSFTARLSGSPTSSLDEQSARVMYERYLRQLRRIDA